MGTLLDDGRLKEHFSAAPAWSATHDEQRFAVSALVSEISAGALVYDSSDG